MIKGYKNLALPLPGDLPEDAEWIDLLTTFSPKAGETLVSLIVTLYPYDGLPTPVYRRAVLAFDRLAAYSAVTRELIDQTVTSLDGASPWPFRARAESSRIADLKAIETTAGFILLQRMAVRYLHDGLEAWQAFGHDEAPAHQGVNVERAVDWFPPLSGIPGDREAT